MEKQFQHPRTTLAELRNGFSQLLSVCGFIIVMTPWTHLLRYSEDFRDLREVIAFQSVGAVGMLLAGVVAPKRTAQIASGPIMPEHGTAECAQQLNSCVDQNPSLPSMAVPSAEQTNMLLQQALGRPVVSANTTTLSPTGQSEQVPIAGSAVDFAPASLYS